jgi:hypothetical protein
MRTCTKAFNVRKSTVAAQVAKDFSAALREHASGAVLVVSTFSKLSLNFSKVAADLGAMSLGANSSLFPKGGPGLT